MLKGLLAVVPYGDPQRPDVITSPADQNAKNCRKEA
jgi:hypothetical protein